MWQLQFRDKDSLLLRLWDSNLLAGEFSRPMSDNGAVHPAQTPILSPPSFPHLCHAGSSFGMHFGGFSVDRLTVTNWMGNKESWPGGPRSSLRSFIHLIQGITAIDGPTLLDLFAATKVTQIAGPLSCGLQYRNRLPRASTQLAVEQSSGQSNGFRFVVGRLRSILQSCATSYLFAGRTLLHGNR